MGRLSSLTHERTLLSTSRAQGISVAGLIFSPAVGCIIAAAIFYFGYKIEDTQILRMQDEIVARKAGVSAK